MVSKELIVTIKCLCLAPEISEETFPTLLLIGKLMKVRLL